MLLQLFEPELPDLTLDQKIGGNKAQYVHEPVPSYLEGTNAENYRINMWIGKHKYYG